MLAASSFKGSRRRRNLTGRRCLEQPTSPSPPVTESVLGELTSALVLGADDVRGSAAAEAPPALAELARAFERGDVTVADVLALPSDAVAAALTSAGLDPRGSSDSPLDMAAVLAAVESLPREVTKRLLVEFLAGLVEP